MSFCYVVCGEQNLFPEAHSVIMISLGSGICCEVSTHKSYHSGDFLLDFFLGGGEGLSLIHI